LHAIINVEDDDLRHYEFRLFFGLISVAVDVSYVSQAESVTRIPARWLFTMSPHNTLQINCS